LVLQDSRQAALFIYFDSFFIKTQRVATMHALQTDNKRQTEACDIGSTLTVGQKTTL